MGRLLQALRFHARIKFENKPGHSVGTSYGRGCYSARRLVHHRDGALGPILVNIGAGKVLRPSPHLGGTLLGAGTLSVRVYPRLPAVFRQPELRVAARATV
jgi:hypothetical protein